MARPSVRIDIISDTVCPWCYVGKRRLEQAMKQYNSKLDFQVHWHPFQLNPQAQQEGVDKLQFYRSKFGAQVDMIIPRMTETFAELGLEYSIGGLTGNTLNSHLLIHWAGKTGGWQVQNAVVEELFANYMCQEKHINDKDVLLAAVSKAGLDVEAAKKVLDSPGSLLDEVQDALGSAYRQRVTGVPYFTINGQYRLSGAQPPEVFTEVFEKIVASSGTAGGEVQGATCTPGGNCA